MTQTQKSATKTFPLCRSWRTLNERHKRNVAQDIPEDGLPDIRAASFAHKSSNPAVRACANDSPIVARIPQMNPIKY